MNDECWRDLLATEHRGDYTRSSAEMTLDQLKEWAISVGISPIWIDEIEEGNRKKRKVRPFQSDTGRMIDSIGYYFGANAGRRIWYIILGRRIFVWFSKKDDAALFKLTFGGA